MIIVLVSVVPDSIIQLRVIPCGLLLIAVAHWGYLSSLGGTHTSVLQSSVQNKLRRYRVLILEVHGK
jgi:hypothetical protein